MKNILLPLFCTLFLFGRAQHMSMPNYHYTPQTPRIFSPFSMYNNYGYYGTVSQKHRFMVLLKDSTSLLITAKIEADSTSRFLVYTDRSVKRSDSGRTKRIYPTQTLSISRLDKSGVTEYKGLPADSCWLFPAIQGPLSAYAALAEDEIDDEFLLYIRQGEGPMIRLTAESLEAIVKDNEKAESLLKKKKYSRAINKYNDATAKP
ncbi:hypothetical protein [Puia dinghuensis]|uniref:Uncharacterized protein n=1 Tax=Puia dinghuensis TaxID=1792502 RepID=A0A8J2U953_9BACT|nr:hypothetical protein [Puia dinghuensis]GGA86891.1 hypothetical protein GCM10011511_07460 [Puia dinghuensis]